MIASEWGDWLPQRVAAAQPDGIAVWYLGCNGFILKAADGTTIFIDPYLGSGDPPRTVRMIPVPFEPEDIDRADAILGTHEHTDHVHGPSQAPILARTGGTLYAPAASLAVTEAEAWPAHLDLTDEQMEAVAPGDTLTLGDVTIHVRDAYDPDAREPVSYVIEHAAGCLFHGGDSKPSEAFQAIGEEFDIDVAIVAIGSHGNLTDPSTGSQSRTKWYASPDEAIEIANAVRTDRLLPSHWDMWKGFGVDPTAVYAHASSFPYPRSVEIVEIGDRVDL